MPRFARRYCMQHISGIAPHIIIIGMPLAIMRVIMSQHILSMSMLIAPVGIIMHFIPCGVISQVIFGIIGIPQHIIIGIPLQVIMTGIPLAIMSFIMAQQSFIISMSVPSAGIIMHIMPLGVTEQAM
jgi:hypothetical protein